MKKILDHACLVSDGNALFGKGQYFRYLHRSKPWGLESIFPHQNQNIVKQKSHEKICLILVLIDSQILTTNAKRNV